ncbi:uncharacterized protein FA14DRAFT_160354 [Meira miltonrushii]|uniref:K Homology domain-containing protein n=1 Tax=Meira miltonrushii TaxID=1280837 RepID=A0A316VCH5_9BASI|nr:uncharacterized protein FA14DRAFT_160354 [Meira miltonrushii]PWN35004.1 hypothetical protein FA14DRAFT_160354 [Meira miltonrushii]
MEVYSTSFTVPRSSSDAISFAEERPALSSPASLHAAAAAAAASTSPNSNSTLSEVNNIQRNDAIQPRRQDGSTFARFGSMRSRLPPSVKAFMPAAFGGSKRTSDRIAEAVGTGSEKESETEAEGDENAATGTIKEDNKAKETPSTTKNLVSLFKDRSNETSNDPPAAEQGDSEKHEKKETQIDEDAKDAETVKNDFIKSSPTKNRDSRSTVGTKSSVDLSSSASVDSTAPSTAAAFGGKTGLTPSEPRSASHSASGSLSTFGYAQNPFGAQDMQEAMQKLSSETMNSHQCLVHFTPVETETLRTLQSNGSSTSLSSDPFHRNTFPSMPPSSSSFASPHLAFPYMPGMDPGSGFGTSKSGSMPARSPVNFKESQSGKGGKSSSHFNFHLSGGYQQVMAARGQVLREHPFRSRATIKVPRNDLLTTNSSGGSINGSIPSENLKADIRKRFDEIASLCSCMISISANEQQGSDLGNGLETERSAEIIIAGPFEGVEQAKVLVMVMLDELAGLSTEVVEVDYKFHNIVGGRKRCVIQKIQEETGTNIYLATPFPSVLSANRSPSIVSRQNTIFITGEYFGVQRARDMFFQVSMHKSKNVLSRNTAVLPRKIDWLLTDRLEDLRSIMQDNATFIGFPMLGSQASLLTIYGDNRVSIERTIRSVMQLACQFFIASVWLLPISFDGVMAPNTVTAAQVTPILKYVSTNSGAEVAFKNNCFEMHGTESQVRASVSLLLESDLLKTFNLEIRFQIELANEHRDFISGKKNGKINKIMKQGVRIKFETFNDFNFLIDVSSNDRAGTVSGLSLLLEELPAEMSFHIPENYHKRIIGVGGKNIQKTMKKFGVYVKFYSKQDLDIETYPFLDAEDNVIARTPAKNAVNLENLKMAVTELVSPKDKDFVCETVPIARRYHRTLLGEKGIFIHDIENKLGCMIRFPPPESANDLVSIFGPESQIHIAAQMLLDHVPFEAEFRAPESVELTRVLESHEFVALVERVKRDLNVNIVPMSNQASSSPTAPVQDRTSPPASDVVFKLRLNRSSADFLPAAKDALEDFLISRNIQIYRAAERNRADSFASSFHHFANKLISVPQAAESTDSFQTDPSARYNRQQMQMQQQQLQQQENNRLRAAASTPDIKALFDSPSMASGPFIPPSVPMSGSNITPKSTMYTSPYQDALRTSAAFGGSEVWGAPTNLTGKPNSIRTNQPPGPSSLSSNATSHTQPSTPSSAGIAFPQHVTRFSDDVGAMQQPNNNQGMYGDGMGFEDRVNTLRKSRAYSHRAQSLDIGALAAQQVIQQAMSAGHPRVMTGSSSSGSFGSAAEMGIHPQASLVNQAHANSMNNAQRPFGAIGSKLSGANDTNQPQHHHVGGSNSFSGTHGVPFNASMLGGGGGGGNGMQHVSGIPSHHSAHHSLPPTYGNAPTKGPGYGQFYNPTMNINMPQQSNHKHVLQQQQQQHHHLPSPSISRLAPSSLQRAPGPETADEVLRSLEQLHFQPPSN